MFMFVESHLLDWLELCRQTHIKMVSEVGIAPTLTLLATLWAPWTMTRWHVDVVGMLERRIMRWCGFKT